VTACLNSSWSHIYCTYPSVECASSFSCLFSLAGTEGSNSSNAHIGNCSSYDQKVCCGLSNFAPLSPVLEYPVNGNITVFERNINFSWLETTDPEGDSLTYSLNISCGSSCPANCLPVNVDGLTTLSYLVSSPLCVDYSYNWSVSACDGISCNSSLIWNFTILSTAMIDLIVNSTSFGEVSLGDSNDTSDGSPSPLVVRNIGNVIVNLTINATQLFSNGPLNSEYFQFATDDNESGSIAYSYSQTSFAPFDSDPKNIICNLTYNDSHDEAKIHLSIEVPPSEPSGLKRSDIQLNPIQVE
jgi:hypothetical protein